MKRIYLDFFGKILRICSDDNVVLNRISFIFREFISKEAEPNIFFVITPITDTKDDEFTLTKNSINVRYSYDGFNYHLWDFEDTFLPPMRIDPFSNTHLVLHGCAVKSPNGYNLVFLAPSMSGKTTLVISLLENGFKCISDDLLFINNGFLKTYKKPVGIRETGISVFGSDKINKWINGIDKLSFLNSENKTTWLCHLDDIFNDCYSEEQVHRIDYLFVPNFKNVLTSSIRTQDVVQYILQSMCETGCTPEKIQKELISIMMNIRSAYTLDTSDLKEALNLINKVTKGEISD